MRFTCILFVLAGVANAFPQEKVNPGAATLSDFDRRVSDYLKLRKDAMSKAEKLKSTKSSEAIDAHEKRLAHEIRESRRRAIQGAIFTREIATRFRELIAETMRGPEAARIQSSLKQVVSLRPIKMRVNDTYPQGVPLESTPATLLQNFPKLPQELEYRLVGRTLILRDSEANLIVDLMENAIP